MTIICLITFTQVMKAQGNSNLLLAWKHIFNQDQQNRGPNASVSIDSANLISVCKLIDKYGYPTKAEYGKYADAPWLVWIHSRSYKQKELTFKMIQEGHKKEEITDERYLNYFLRSLYHDKFCISPKRLEPSKQNIEKRLLEINPKEYQSFLYDSIKESLASVIKYDDLINKKVIGKWGSSFDANGARYLVEIIEFNNRLFFVKKTVEPFLYEITDFKEREDDCINYYLKHSVQYEYLELNTNGILKLKNENETFMEYGSPEKENEQVSH